MSQVLFIGGSTPQLLKYLEIECHVVKDDATIQLIENEEVCWYEYVMYENFILLYFTNHISKHVGFHFDLNRKEKIWSLKKFIQLEMNQTLQTWLKNKKSCFKGNFDKLKKRNRFSFVK